MSKWVLAGLALAQSLMIFAVICYHEGEHSLGWAAAIGAAVIVLVLFAIRKY